MRASLSVLVGAALLLYPILVYFGQTHFGPQWIALAVIVVSGLRLAVWRFGSSPPEARAVFGTPQVVSICLGAIVLALASAWSGSPDAMLYYPVLVNAILLLLFGSSLVWPPTVVERIARLRHQTLPVEAVRYLHRVTAVWCLFFVANGAAALYTATRTSFETWALYNGLIAYALIGAMFLGEFLTRQRVMRNLRE